MNTLSYFTVWAGMFILTAGLGFIPNPQGGLKFLLIAMSLGFFLPPAFLLRHAETRGEKQTIETVRNLAVCSLVLTFVLIVANFFSLMASTAVGNALYVILTIVSAPMICSQYWMVSLFGWACLMIWAQKLLKK
jgi:hypothetical protein